MKFTFLCPQTHRSFETSDFRIVEDRGVVIDSFYRKHWDAKVTVICPFCEKAHTYLADELPCPFTSKSEPHHI
jgi:hypothetical protein